MPDEEKKTEEPQGADATQLAPIERPEMRTADGAQLAEAIQETADLNYLMKAAEFAHLQRVAQMFADSLIIPDRFQKNVADCAIVLAMAWRHRADPMMFFNGVYVVHGRPGMEAKLAIALVNSQRVFTGPIQYRFTGEAMARECTAFATHRQSGQPCEATVTMEMAKAEGWLKNTKWISMPDVMLRYRSAAFLIRAYCPEAMYGMSTYDELQEITAQSVNVEVLDKQRQEIRDKVAAASARPALPEVTAEIVEPEKPLTEVIAAAPKVDETRKPAPSATVAAPDDMAEPGSDPAPAPKPPQPTAEERRAEREAIAATYRDLCEAAGEKAEPITKLSTPKLKKECERLTAELSKK